MITKLNRKEFEQDLLENQLGNHPEWVEKLYSPLHVYDESNPLSPSEIIRNEQTCPTDLHGVFLNAFIHLPTSGFRMGEYKDQYQRILHNILQKDVNTGVQSWVSELIQNSVDIGAKKITIDVTKDDMTFSHNGLNDTGEVFTPSQLSYLFTMNTSTKMGDFTKIGQFGVGFKYWWWFFENAEIMVDDGEYSHSLKLNNNFDPNKTEYSYTTSSNETEPTTRFKFTNPVKNHQDEIKWLEYIEDEAANIYGERVFRSLPFIQSRTGGDFEINMSSPSSNSKLFCNVKDSKTYENFVVDTVNWGRTDLLKSGNDQEFEHHRVTSTLDAFKKSDKKLFSKFKEFVLGEYRNSRTLESKIEKDGSNFEEEIQKIADEALVQSKINLLITPDEKFTYPANLFVINSEASSKLSSAFYADAPWQTSQNRVTLDMDTETTKQAWNIVVARFVDRLYSRFIKHTLNDSKNLGYTAVQMFELINRPIGETSVLSNECYDLDGKFNEIYSAYVNSELTLFGKRVNHLQETFSLQGEDIGVANKALAHLWKKLQKTDAGYKSARTWLENSLHEDLAIVKLANKEFAPVTIGISNADIFNEIDGKPPVICRNLGKGIPSIIKTTVQKLNFVVEDTDQENKDQLLELWENQIELFDDIVSASLGGISFANDGEKIICDVTEEDNLNLLKSCLEIIESELDEKILHFLSNSKNITSHKTHLGRKGQLPSPLNFDNTMEELLILAYSKSLENVNLKKSTEFKQWLNKNTSKHPWNDVILLKTIGDDCPILVKMPPRAHMLCVIVGLEGRRHLESIKIESLEHSEPEIRFSKNKPSIHRWGKRKSEEVFVSPDYYDNIEDLLNPWKENKKSPELDDSDNWEWSDMSPNGETGWIWPQVNVSIDDVEVRSNVLSRITPVFIDGLHVILGTTFAGIHSGFRIKDENQNILSSKENFREAIHHYASGPTDSENAIELVHLDFLSKSKIKSFELLSHSIEHEMGSKYYPYRTTKSGKRVYLNIAKSYPNHENNLKPHGQIRVLGLMSAIMEQHDFRSDDELERLSALVEIQTISKQFEEHNIRFFDKSIIYDVPLLRGGTISRKEGRQIGLIGIFIPYEKFETKNYIDDKDRIILRSSDRYNDLRNCGLAGYLPTQIDRPNRIYSYTKKDYQNRDWLPRLLPETEDGVLPEEFQTQEKYGIETVPICNREDMTELMQDKTSNLGRDITHRENIDADRWIFRWGLNKLLLLISKDGEEKNFCLDWLEHLLDCQLPMIEWASTPAPWKKYELTSKPRDILLNAINGNEHLFPNITKLTENKDEVDLWDDFVRACWSNITTKQVLRERRTTKLRKLEKTNSGDWIVNKGDINLTQLKKRESEEKVRFIVSDIDFFSDKVVDIDDDADIFFCPNQYNSRKVWDTIKSINSAAVVEIDLVKKILETEFSRDSENKLEQVPNSFKYVDDLLSGLFSSKKRNWYNFSETAKVGNIGLGGGGIAIAFTDDEYIHIRTKKDDCQLSTHDHNLIAQLLVDYLLKKHSIDKKQIKQWISKSSENYPEQFFLALEMEYDLDKRYQFISNYCRDELNFEKFQSELLDVKNDEELKNILHALKKKYREDKIELENKELLLRKLYKGITSIIQGRSSFLGISNPNNPYSVRYWLTIGNHMVSQMKLKEGDARSFSPKLSGTLGNTLLLNVNEQDWFRRFASLHDSGEQYDFAPDGLEKMEKALANQWFNENSEFIKVEGIFVNQDDESFAGSFHREHLIHIVAMLSKFVVVDYAE